MVCRLIGVGCWEGRVTRGLNARVLCFVYVRELGWFVYTFRFFLLECAVT